LGPDAGGGGGGGGNNGATDGGTDGATDGGTGAALVKAGRTETMAQVSDAAAARMRGVRFTD